MIPTVFGLMVVAIGGWLLLRGSPQAMLAFVMISSLFGGSAALVLPALGSSSIAPAYLALGFLMLKVVLSTPTGGSVASAFRGQFLLVIFCVYGAASAFILPRMFQGQIEVWTMRSTHFQNEHDVAVPLRFTSQNITTAAYLLGTAMAALSSAIVCRRPNSDVLVARVAVVIGYLHVAFGLLDLLLSHVGLRYLLDYIRNGNYAQLDQQFNGLVRIQGILPEASTYASYAFIWFVFLFELWLRNYESKRTGPAAAALAGILIISTSSSAYVSMLAYALILAMRLLIFPNAWSARKLGTLAIFTLCGLIVSLSVIAASGKTATLFQDMLSRMTFGKVHTISGMQRLQWARQGVAGFRLSRGLGIGPGSFRSSSISMAILGSTGIVGFVAFHLSLFGVIKPGRASTFGVVDNRTTAAGVAASWAAVVGCLLPMEINSPTCDPGLIFGVLCGMGIAWRAASANPIPNRGPVDALQAAT